jgi:betaine-aldehyde dehydrogenase
MFVKDRLFIGGEWARPAGTGHIDVVSASTEEVIGRVPDGTAGDIDAAVRAARAAFDSGPWPRLEPSERAKVLASLSENIQARFMEFAQLITGENGTPIQFSMMGQALGAAMVVDSFVNLADSIVFEEERTGLTGTSLVRRAPVGVVGVIVPWNAPLILSLLKVAPALLTGCTCVVKPAPETPLDAYVLAECLADAGLPPGVVNIVAAGREVGEHLVTHPAVDKISFTGSTQAGKRIAALCGERVRRVTLELGGKSAAIVCDDADMETTVPALVPAGMMINGQACAAQTRILAPRSRYGELVDALADAVSRLKVGDPYDDATDVGPLVAERQRARVEGYIASGRSDGARVVTGGGRPAGLDRGWYVEPTVFADVDNSMRIAREEIFGPVVCVIPYDTVDDAVAIAEDSPYGLSGSVWSADAPRALEIARRIRTGSVTVNGWRWDCNFPSGGFKESGLGREGGPEGLEAYCEYQTINLPAPLAELSAR